MAGKGRQNQQQDERALLFVGTTNGIFVYDGDFQREKWKRTGPHLKGHAINSILYDYRDQKTVYVGTSGAGLQVTRDFGRSWEKVGKGLPSDDVTHITLGHSSEPESVYVGLRPSGIAKSDDGGDTFEVIEGFLDAPSRGEWWGQGGDAHVQSIVVHPDSPDKIHVAVSVAGVFLTTDGGATWESRNDGLPASFPNDGSAKDVHREIHRLVGSSANPDRLFAVASTGVFRTDDNGTSWRSLSDGLSSPVVRALAISPSRPSTLFAVPLPGGTPEEPRVQGQLAVYRSTDGGDEWNRIEEGLPGQVDAAVNPYAMCVDSLLEEGVYFATSQGGVFISLEDGESWYQIATGLTPVLSIEIITEEE